VQISSSLEPSRQRVYYVFNVQLIAVEVAPAPKIAEHTTHHNTTYVSKLLSTLASSDTKNLPLPYPLAGKQGEHSNAVFMTSLGLLGVLVKSGERTNG
jgi:hypothetical protein